MRLWLYLLFMMHLGAGLRAQRAGGDAVYPFLRLPAGALAAALGDINVSVPVNDISLASQNPALFREAMDGQLSASFNSFSREVRALHLAGGLHHAASATNVGVAVRYLGYGELAATDAGGNETGSFRPRDYVASMFASRRYGQRWQYGATLHYIGSQYGIYRSAALAMDIGIHYNDSSRQFQAGLVMKHMGFQLRSYSGEGKENLPFDLQAGVSKRLANAPLQFSLTARELHRLILFEADSNSNGRVDQVLQHLIVAGQFYVAERVELTAAYNHLRRSELRIANAANGLTGISLGVGVLLPRLQLRYARSNMSRTRGWNQVALTLQLKRKDPV